MCMDTPSPFCNSIELRGPCNLNSKCVSHYCDNNICQYYSRGRCYRHSQCPSGYCNNGYCGLVNTVLIEDGGSCFSHSQCSSSSCTDHVCTPYINGAQCKTHNDCSKFTNVSYGCCINDECVYSSFCHSLDKDQDCEFDYECLSNSCYHSKCTNPDIWRLYLLVFGFPIALCLFVPIAIITTRKVITRIKNKGIRDMAQVNRRFEIVKMNAVNIEVRE